MRVGFSLISEIAKTRLYPTRIRLRPCLFRVPLDWVCPVTSIWSVQNTAFPHDRLLTSQRDQRADPPDAFPCGHRLTQTIMEWGQSGKSDMAGSKRAIFTGHPDGISIFPGRQLRTTDRILGNIVDVFPCRPGELSTFLGLRLKKYR